MKRKIDWQLAAFIFLFAAGLMLPNAFIPTTTATGQNNAHSGTVIQCQHTYVRAYIVMTKEITEGVQMTCKGGYGWVDRSYLIPVMYCTKCGVIDHITPEGIKALHLPY